MSLQDALAEVAKPLSKDHHSKASEAECFGQPLKAIYNMPCEISGLFELKVLTRLADFYLCLPALSSSISTALFNSSGLLSGIKGYPLAIIVEAIQLRHLVLFREALVLSVSA